MARHQHLIRRHRTWYVRMVVPADVQGIVGQRALVETTGETGLPSAGWGGWIRASRGRRRGDPLHAGPHLGPR